MYNTCNRYPDWLAMCLVEALIGYDWPVGFKVPMLPAVQTRALEIHRILIIKLTNEHFR